MKEYKIKVHNIDTDGLPPHTIEYLTEGINPSKRTELIPRFKGRVLICCTGDNSLSHAVPDVGKDPSGQTWDTDDGWEVNDVQLWIELPMDALSFSLDQKG